MAQEQPATIQDEYMAPADVKAAVKASKDPVSAVTVDPHKPGPKLTRSRAMRYLKVDQKERAKLLFAKYDFSPIETLVAVATDPQCDPDLKKSIAAMLLPYEVPKLKSLDLNVSHGGNQAPRVMIKNFTVVNGQAVPQGQTVDVTPENAAQMPKPLADAMAAAQEAQVDLGMVEVALEDEDDEEEAEDDRHPAA